MVRGSPFIVIGIDYGTTYSGAAWSKSGTPDQVEVISQWGSQTPGAADSDKVPSDISYDANNRPVKWGFGLDSTDSPLRWVKLLLSRSSLDNLNNSQEPVLDATRAQLDRMDITPVNAIADYLRFLWRHVLERLRIRLTQAVLDNMIFKIVLTVPAIWDHRAQEDMRLAAKNAGLLEDRPCGKTELTLVAEPAAAALAAYVDAAISLNPLVQIGDSFVVCDAGGGTVDLISYVVQGFEPFRLSECIGATGDLCGAIYVDRAFEVHVKALRKYMRSLSKDVERRFMEKEWENNVKRIFDGSDGPWPVDLPYKPPKSGMGLLKALKKEKPSVLALERESLVQMFACVLPKIVDLLKDQVAGITRKTGFHPKVIILVGGFGGNRYLLQQLESHFPNITIQQPTRAWSAVCRGAVYRGLQGGDRIVSNHISKYHYGCQYGTPWDDEKHLEEDKVFDERRQEWMAMRQIRWYLRKHDDVKNLRPVEHHFTKFILYPQELSEIAYRILVSDHEDPGTRRMPDIQQRLCTVNVQFQADQFEQFPLWTNSIGNTYRRVDMIFEMTISVSSIDWVVTCEGNKVPVVVDYVHPELDGQIPT